MIVIQCTPRVPDPIDHPGIFELTVLEGGWTVKFESTVPPSQKETDCEMVGPCSSSTDQLNLLLWKSVQELFSSREHLKVEFKIELGRAWISTPP